MPQTAISANAAADWLHLGACELGRRVAAGELSARESIETAIARIEAVDERLNSVVFRRYDEARREADALGAARRRGETLGPLAGVPLSVKECFFMPGTPSTVGVDRFVGVVYEEEYAPLARLRAAGAIVIAKTNVPQLMLMHETDNPIYGRTNNPWDLDRVPGGSSGGEAALLAAGGAALGLGNDLGGSIRVPAHFCGICGLKPTEGRFTNAGAFANVRGLEAFLTTTGPLARRVDDLALAMRAMTEPNGQDSLDSPRAWRHGELGGVEGMRIGWCDDDGFFPAAPALRRAVAISVDALAAAGAELVPFALREMPEAIRLYFGLVSADGGADARRLLGSSRRDWRVRRLLALASMPWFVRRPGAAVMRSIGQRRLADLFAWTGPISADQYWQLTWQLCELGQRFAQRWQAAGLDALVLPPHSLPALRHGASGELGMAASYSMFFNVLGWPAGVVPVTRVAAGEESDRPASRDRVDRLAAECEQGSAGLPVGVQVVAPRWRDEVALTVMRSIETAVGSRDDCPARMTASLPIVK